MILLVLLLLAPAHAAEVRDERRLWSDGSVREVWTYEDEMLPERLVRKEWFYEDGQEERIERYVAGVQHGATKTWHRNGNKHIEEPWVEGGIHGVVRHWPDPDDDSKRKKGLKPELEANWANGQPHGAWTEWSGWLDDRWMRVEKAYVDGKLDGTETIWKRAEQMDRKHSYAAGQLDGRQLAWDFNGAMEYQYNFKAGLPHGPQRKYAGEEVKLELFFDEGRLHGDCTWEHWQSLGRVWRHGLMTTEGTCTNREDDTEYVCTRDRWRFVPEDRFDQNGRLRFYGDIERVDRQSFDATGHRTKLEADVPGGFWMEFGPDGRPAVVSAGTKREDGGRLIRLYDDGSLFREEFHARHKKIGEWGTWDRQGRRVATATWDYNLERMLVTTWHDAETKASEGEVRAINSNSGPKDGTWTYWRPDGSKLRVETYGPGPYSGNRPFIQEMTEWNEDGTVRFDGSDRDVVLYSYEDGAVVRKSSIRLLERSRHALESWDDEQLTVVRRPVKEGERAVLAEGARTVELMGGRGVVVADEVLRADGSTKQLLRWDREGNQHGAQEGWRADGSATFRYEYHRGTLQTAAEWWKDGSPRLVAEFRHHDGAYIVSSATLVEPGGRAHEWEADKRWKGPAELLDRCLLWRFEDALPRP